MSSAFVNPVLVFGIAECSLFPLFAGMPASQRVAADATPAPPEPQKSVLWRVLVSPSAVILRSRRGARARDRSSWLLASGGPNALHLLAVPLLVNLVFLGMLPHVFPPASAALPIPALGYQGILRGKFVAPTTMCPLRNRRYQPTLANHVSRVIERRSEKQVGGITAGRIVAVVTHKQPVGNEAVRQLPRTAVGRNPYPLTADVPNMELPVSGMKNCSLPRPAVTRFVDLRPKFSWQIADFHAPKITRIEGVLNADV